MIVTEKDIDLKPSAVELYANAVSHGSGRETLMAAFTHNDIGRRLVRLKYANKAEEFDACLETLRLVAVHRNRKWKADPQRIHPLVKRVLEFWITDACPECLGRGAKQIPDTPHLDEPCHCNGGIRQWKQPDPWHGYGRDLLSWLDEEVLRFQQQMAGRKG